MCESWKNPSRIEEEFSPAILEKIPGGMKRLNITGGEPLLRKDLIDIISVLDTKTRRLEISTNGYFTDKIVAIAEKFPRITIRVSIEGLTELNDKLRGIKNGYDHALRTIIALKAMGLKDIGFAMVISHNNISDLLNIYRFTTDLGVEFSQSAMHNSFYFFKHNNKIENIELVNDEMIEFIDLLLRSNRTNLKLMIKDWFRAYINAGLLRYMKGESRAIPCYAGTESFFIDPHGMILACNGSEKPLIMGDLKTHAFEDIWISSQSEQMRKLVKNCGLGCWMTGSSVPAMRRNIFKPAFWVLRNKIRIKLNRRIDETI